MSESTHDLVVGIDFSENSQAALREAARLAGALHQGLEVVTVVPEEVLAALSSDGIQSEEAVMATAAGNLEEWAREELGRASPTVEPSFRALAGDPFERLAETAGTGLLVLGSRGIHSAAGRTGAVASRCVRLCRGPVLLIRRGQVQPFRRVVIGWDESPAARAALDWAVTVARADGAELVVAHIQIPVVIPDALGLGAYLPPIDPLPLEQALRERFERELADLPVAWPARRRVEVITDGTVAGGLSRLAEDREADLLVVGTHGRRGWRKLMLGTTAEHLIHDSPCSVLAVKEG